MQMPLQISFHGMGPSPAIEAHAFARRPPSSNASPIESWAAGDIVRVNRREPFGEVP